MNAGSNITFPSKQDTADLLEIIQNSQRGDHVAFASLYDKYAPALNGVILRMVNYDIHVAQDCLQDTFLKIFNHIADYSADKGTIFTWVLTIARNTALDKLRNIQSKQCQSLDIIVGMEHICHPHLSIDSIGVFDILKNLNSEHQSLIHLAYYKGMSQRDIADHLNMPLGTVKTKTRAAMLRLRKIWS